MKEDECVRHEKPSAAGDPPAWIGVAIVRLGHLTLASGIPDRQGDSRLETQRGERCVHELWRPALCSVYWGPRAATPRPARRASTPTTTPGAPPITEVSGAELQKNIPLTGVQGVTNTAINVATITTKTNCLVGCYSAYVDGITAYFNYMNSTGGIYGRKLVISANRDDQFLNNEQTVKASLAQDKPFALFEANALAGSRLRRHRGHQPADANVHLEHQPGDGRSHQHLRDLGRAVLQLHRPGHPVARPAVSASRRSRSSRYGTTASSKQCAEAETSELPEVPVGEGRVLRLSAAVPAGRPQRRREQASSRAAPRSSSPASTATSQSILGKELVKQHVNAVQQLPNALRRDLREGQRRSTSRAPSCRRSSRRSSTSRSWPRPSSSRSGCRRASSRSPSSAPKAGSRPTCS